MWISVLTLYVSVVCIPPSALTSQAAAVNRPLLPRAPLPNSAPKAPKIKSPMWNSQPLTVSPFIRPANKFDAYLKRGDPFQNKLSEKQLEFNEVIPRPQPLATRRRPRLKIPQANVQQKPQTTAVSKLLQFTLPQASRPPRVDPIMDVEDRARRRLNSAKLKKMSDESHKKEANRKPQWIPAVYKDITPSIADNKILRPPNARARKGRFRIPRADMGPSATTSGVSTNQPYLVSAVTEGVSFTPNSVEIPGADLDVDVDLPFSLSPDILKDFSFPGSQDLKSSSPLFPTASYTEAPKIDQNASRPEFVMGNLSILLGLRRQQHKEWNDRSWRELHELTFKQIEQAVYTTNTDHLPVVERIAAKYSDDLRFRMAFIFLRIDEIKHEMHTMYSYLKHNLNSYPWWRFWQSYHKINQRIHMLYYTHFIRKNVDITYAIEYLLELCKTTDEQIEAFKKQGLAMGNLKPNAG